MDIQGCSSDFCFHPPDPRQSREVSTRESRTYHRIGGACADHSQSVWVVLWPVPVKSSIKARTPSVGRWLCAQFGVGFAFDVRRADLGTRGDEQYPVASVCMVAGLSTATDALPVTHNLMRRTAFLFG